MSTHTDLPKGALATVWDIAHYTAVWFIVLACLGVGISRATIGAALGLGYLTARLVVTLEDIVDELRNQR